MSASWIKECIILNFNKKNPLVGIFPKPNDMYFFLIELKIVQKAFLQNLPVIQNFETKTSQNHSTENMIEQSCIIMEKAWFGILFQYANQRCYFALV